MSKLLEFLNHPLFYKSLAIITVFACIYLWQHYFFFQRQLLDVTRIIKNIGLWCVNLIISPFLITPLTVYFMAEALWVRPVTFSGPWIIFLDLLILDLWIYIWHRANHEVPILWRFHAIHHYDTTMDVFTAFRFHPVEVLLSACARLPIILCFAIPIETLILFETLLFCNALYHHGNITLPDWLKRSLAKIIVSPEWHWVHHHALREDTDSHYGGLFTIWDKIFGTTRHKKRFPQMGIGVALQQDRSLFNLLFIRPFQKS